MKKEMVIDKLEELYDQIKREEHDQMVANGVQRAIDVLINIPADELSDEGREMNDHLKEEE